MRSVKDRQSNRGERILVLPLRTRKSPLLDQRQITRMPFKEYAFQFSSYPIELDAYLK